MNVARARDGSALPVDHPLHARISHATEAGQGVDQLNRTIVTTKRQRRLCSFLYFHVVESEPRHFLVGKCRGSEQLQVNC